MPKKLIVNADDFGLSSAINRGIQDGHRSGIITATSIMACGEAFSDACAISQKNPDLDVGIHLSLDEERPVLGVNYIPSLIGLDGKFHTRSKLIVKLTSGRVSLKEIESEWSAQIKKCLDSKLKISHLDSHGHIHVFPSLINIAEQLRRSYKIPRIRKPAESLIILGHQAGLKGYVKKILVSLAASYSFWKERIPKENTTDFFLGLAASGNMNSETFWHLMRGLKEGTNELMIHPGYTDVETNACYGYWNYHWQSELDTIKLSAQERERLKVKGILLTNFKSNFNQAL